MVPKNHKIRRVCLTTFLFLFLFSFSSFVFADDIINIKDGNTIDKINLERDVLASINSEKPVSIGVNNKIFVYEDYGSVYISNSSHLSNSDVVMKNGIIAVRDYKKGYAEVEFITNMPNTPFSVKVYDGLTSDRDLIRREGRVLHNMIYSDDYGVVRYRTYGFSSQILDFPSPLEHSFGGETTTYYLNYFFEDYNKVSVDCSSCSMTEISDFMVTEDAYEDDAEYDDVNKTITLQHIGYVPSTNPRLRFTSKDNAEGWSEVFVVKAYDIDDNVTFVADYFTWTVEGSGIGEPSQINNLPENVSKYYEQQYTIYFDDYIDNYNATSLIFFDYLNDSSVSLLATSELGDCDSYQSTNISIDLCGFGSDTGMGLNVVANQTLLSFNFTLSFYLYNGSFVGNVTDHMSYNVIGEIPSSSSGTDLNTSLKDLITMNDIYDDATYNYGAKGNYNMIINSNTQKDGIISESYDFSASSLLSDGIDITGTGKNKSYAFWLNSSVDSTYQYLYSSHFNGGQQNGQSIIITNINTLRTDYIKSGSGASVSSANTTITTGWHYYVMVFDYTNAIIKFYKDGVRTHTETSANLNFDYITTDVQPRLACGGGDGQCLGSDNLDEFGIWEKALTQDDIDYLYNSGLGRNYSDYYVVEAIYKTPPLQTLNFQNLELEYEEAVYIDFDDYFSDYDNITISWNSIVLSVNLNSGWANYTSIPMDIKLNGDSSDINLYIEAGSSGNFSETILVQAYFNGSDSTNDTFSLNLSSLVIQPDPPTQTYNVENVVLNESDSSNISWSAYFDNYQSICLSINATHNFCYVLDDASDDYDFTNLSLFMKTSGNNIITDISTSGVFYKVFTVQAINPYGNISDTFYIDVNAVIVNTSTLPDTETVISEASEVGKSFVSYIIGFFPDSDDLTTSQKFGFVFITLLLVTLLILYSSKNLGSDGLRLGLIASLIIDFSLILFFTAIGYISIFLIIILGLVAVAVAYVMYNRGT